MLEAKEASGAARKNASFQAYGGQCIWLDT